MAKRFCVLFFISLSVFSILGLRLSVLSKNVYFASSTQNQSGHYVEIEDGRGNFYDCEFTQLTGSTYSSYGLVAPTEESYRTLFEMVSDEDKNSFYENIQKSTPFLVEMSGSDLDNYPVYMLSDRYLPSAIAPHLIGYVNETGGVSGLEAAYNDMLEEGATKEQIYCAVNASGTFIDVDENYITQQPGTGFGVMLTIDAAIQRMCEVVAQENITQGAIVVMETNTGKIKAAVSMPTFDPNNLQASLNEEGSPFTNRVISSYNVGSVFKPLLAAIALENGYDKEQEYTCTGSIEIGGHTYNCAHSIGHGEINMSTALEESCNTYFIDLGLKLGPQLLFDAMEEVGFGQSTVVGESLVTAKGNIPTEQELENLGELATLSFGQGKLTATPLQITAYFNAIANNGVYISPTIVQAYVDEYNLEVTQNMYNPVVRQWISPESSNTMQLMLINTVNMGLGVPAKPNLGGAGGKTGTAQTGRYNEDGQEITDAWFVGFYPAYDPQYTVTVMLDSETNTSEQASEIFAEVVNLLYYYL